MTQETTRAGRLAHLAHKLGAQIKALSDPIPCWFDYLHEKDQNKA